VTADLSCDVLHDGDAWERVREAWEPLRAMTPEATPWQRWDFLSGWWRSQQAERRRLCLVVVARAGVPRLILPLQISRAPATVALRWLEPLGMPDDINRPRLGIGPLDRDAYRLAFDRLWAMRRYWDGLRVDERRAEEADVEFLREFAAERGASFRAEPLHPCPYLSLETDWASYIATRGVRLRKNLRAARRKLDARGPWSLQCFESAAEMPAGYALLLDVQERSWKATHGIGLSLSGDYRRFYGEYVRSLAACGAARILVLRSGARPVAATLAVMEGETYYSAMIAHDAEFDDCSPGTLLEALELEALMTERRFRRYDFLGAALANKRRWTDAAIDTSRLVVLPPGPLAWLYESWIYGIRPRVLRFRSTTPGQLVTQVGVGAGLAS
jgi:CelD/BcsL family acetyltransferase involved in cellulose biosynthesis